MKALVMSFFCFLASLLGFAFLTVESIPPLARLGILMVSVGVFALDGFVFLYLYLWARR